MRVPGATILVYHSIPASDTPEIASDAVTVDNFERQMRYLREHSYHLLSLRELVDLMEAGEEIPEGSITVTFDDGYRDTYYNAFPILQNYRIPATVFLAAAYIGSESPFPWLQHEGNSPKSSLPMSWNEVRSLHAAGIEIGSHTFTHRFVPRLTASELRSELARSKAAIKDAIGVSVDALALPFSFPLIHREWPEFADNLAKLLPEHGYRSCCTMERGHLSARDDVYSLRRLPVGSDDDLRLFKAKLEGHYAWTRPFQSLYQQHFKRYPKNNDARGEIAL